MANRLGRQDGQAMVEFALILPLFIALVFIVIGFGITLNNYLRVTDVARVAARDAAIARFDGQTAQCSGATAHDCICATATAAANDALSGLQLNGPVGCDVPDTSSGKPVTITVTVDSENAMRSIPFLSLILPDTLTSKATELVQ